MKLQRFESPLAFYQQVKPFLVEREAEHNLILGLCSELINGVAHGTEPVYVACIYEGDKIVAAALRTPPHHITLSNLAPADALRLIAQDMQQVDEALTGVHGDSATSEAFAHIWQNLTGRTPTLTMRQGLYRLETVKPVADVPGVIRRAAPDDLNILVEWFTDFEREAFASDTVDQERIRGVINQRLQSETRGLYLWEDGKSVSFAGTAGPTPHGIRIGPVYTPPESRRQGYASALVAALSQQMLNSGRSFCSLFTDLSNPTSNRIYQNIGYNPVCDVSLYRFD